MRQLLAIVGVVFLGGCASSAPQTEPTATKPVGNEKNARVSRELSVAWDNIGRGGAAMRQPGYIHVLGDGDVSATINKIADDKPSLNSLSKSFGGSETSEAYPAAMRKDDFKEAISTFNTITKGQGYSLYELSRWERYCSNGNAMDERDWLFIESQGKTNIPSDAITNCEPPTHTYQDYLNSWINFCSSQALTDDQRRIVRESVRPYSVVNPCKALK